MSTTARTDTDWTLSYDADTRTATVTFDLSDPASRPLTKNGEGNAHSLASSHGWTDLADSGARLSFNLTMSKALAAALSKAQADAKPARARKAA